MIETVFRLPSKASLGCCHCANSGLFTRVVCDSDALETAKELSVDICGREESQAQDVFREQLYSSQVKDGFGELSAVANLVSAMCEFRNVVDDPELLLKMAYAVANSAGGRQLAAGQLILSTPMETPKTYHCDDKGLLWSVTPGEQVDWICPAQGMDEIKAFIRTFQAYG